MDLVSADGNAFAEDIRRVAMFGPTHSKLAIVDLTVLIQLHNKCKAEYDVESVNNFVANCMANSSSIILSSVY